MRQASRVRTVAAAVLAAAALALAYKAGRARADGVPMKDGLVYTGFLEMNGQAATGDHTIGVSILGNDNKAVCDVPDATIKVDAGRFSVPFGDACAEAVRTKGPDLYVQVRVEGSPIGSPVKIGAVPFAIEASRADGLTDKARSDVLYPECPPGYAKSASPHVLCTKSADPDPKDEVVRVGTGATAFWIDRYEASVTEKADGSGNHYFYNASTSPASLPLNGAPSVNGDVAYARSVPGASPARSISWLQAETVCRASGKRLPTRREWMAAAQGTTDPGANDGQNGTCDTSSAVGRNSGMGGQCVSRWGAEDMIGNYQEWVAEWHTRPHDTMDLTKFPAWPPSDDVSQGVENTAYDASMAGTKGLPRVEQRGGSFSSGKDAGLFTMILLNGPATPVADVGFRCVIPR